MRLFIYGWQTDNGIQSPGYGIDTKDFGYYFVAYYADGGFSGGGHDVDSLGNNPAVKFINSSSKIPRYAKLKLIDIIFGGGKHGSE
jgi:hypothetical protein